MFCELCLLVMFLWTQTIGLFSDGAYILNGVIHTEFCSMKTLAYIFTDVIIYDSIIITNSLLFIWLIFTLQLVFLILQSTHILSFFIFHRRSHESSYHWFMPFAKPVLPNWWPAITKCSVSIYLYIKTLPLYRYTYMHAYMLTYTHTYIYITNDLFL